MLITIVIAQTFGLFCAVLSTIMFTSKKRLCSMLSDLSSEHSGLMACSLMTLMLGSLLLVVHCHWLDFWHASVSAVGAVLVIGSVLWLTYPSLLVNFAHQLSKEGYYLIYSVFVMLIGVFYLICGLAPVWRLLK